MGSWRFGLLLGVSCALTGLASERMTLREALELADGRHPLIHAAEAGRERATAGITTAKAYPNPSFVSQTGRQMVIYPGNITGLVQLMSFSQPLEVLGGLRPTRIEAARRGLDVAERNREWRRLMVLSHVRRTFFQVVRRQNEIELLIENMRLVEDLRRRIQVRVDVGEAPRLEVVRAETEAATARAQVNSARLRAAGAMADFRAAVGVPVAEGVVLSGALDSPGALPPLEDMQRASVEGHPWLRMARSQVARAEAQVNLERAMRIPQVALRSDFERYPDVPNWRFGVEIPLPLWNRRQGPIAESQAQTRQLKAEEEAQRIQLLSGLEAAYRRYQAATALAELYETAILRQAEAALKATETAYQLGERGIIEVLDAQRLLRSSRLEHLNAQYDRQAALVDLDELRAIDPRSAAR
jgi:cobalt-zinc-cadmium efflux system outer membrane protein